MRVNIFRQCFERNKIKKIKNKKRLIFVMFSDIISKYIIA